MSNRESPYVVRSEPAMEQVVLEDELWRLFLSRKVLEQFR
jgi:hypothetical protein